MDIPNSSTEQRKMAKLLWREIGEDSLKLVDGLAGGDWKERSLAAFLLGFAASSGIDVFSELRSLSMDEDWRVRESVATALTIVSVASQEGYFERMGEWVRDPDARVRRAAIESMRVIARKDAGKVLPFVEMMKKERDRYASDAVAHVIREMTKADPDLVSELLREWARSGERHIRRMVRLGMKKLPNSEREAIRRLLKDG